jgi:ABC-type glycerol-3-phosphate transport system substrate-binding protein
MDDNKGKPPKNQSGPLYESVPVDDSPQPFQPEEVAPDIMSPEDAFTSAPPEIVEDLPPLYEEHKSPLLIIVFAVLFFLVLVGAGGFFLLQNRETAPTEPTEKQDVILTMWGLWEDESVYKPLIEQYQQQNPHVTIQYEKRSSNDYLQGVIARTKNSQGPDIFVYHNTWVPQIQDILAPLSKEVMSNEEFETTFYPIHQKDLRINDSYYGIPLMVDGMMMIYNDDMLRSAGLVAPPSSWVGDLIDAVSKMTVVDREDEIVTAGIAMGTASNVEFFSELYGILLYQNGGSLDALDKRPASEALQVYTEFVDNSFWSESMPNSINAFIEERVAIIFGPSWILSQIRASNPDLNLKVAEMPKGLNEQELSLATYWVEGVTRTSKNQIEAWRFLEYLSSEESLRTMYEIQTQTRVPGAPFSRVDMADEMLQNELLAPVIQQARDDVYISLPLASRTHDQALNEEVIEYLRGAVDRALNSTAYQSALGSAHKGITQALQRNNVELQTVGGEEQEQQTSL